MLESYAPLESLQQLLRTYWRLIVVLAVCGGLGAGAFLLQAPSAYRATAEIVTGTYSLPAEVGTEPAVDKAGPLGLELPAETQARIISSPVVASIAAETLGLGATEAADLLHEISAQPTTDNTFSVRVEGSTPDAAAERANAVASAYLQYRQNTGRRELESLANQANQIANENLEAARALDAPIEAQMKEGNTAYASVMLTRRQELERSAAAASSSAAAFGSASKSFDGGGSVLRPASSRTVTNQLPFFNFIAFGTLAGAGFGVFVAAARRQFGNVRVNREGLAREFPEIFATDSKAGPLDAGLLMRSVERSAAAQGVDTCNVIVRPLSSSRGMASIILALASHFAALGKGCVISTGDGGLWDELSALRHTASPELSWQNGIRSRGRTGGSVIVDAESHAPVLRIFVLPSRGNAESAGWELPAGIDGAAILLLCESDRIRAFRSAVQEHSAAGFPVLGTVFMSSQRPAEEIPAPRHSSEVGQTDLRSPGNMRNMPEDPVTAAGKESRVSSRETFAASKGQRGNSL